MLKLWVILQLRFVRMNRRISHERSGGFVQPSWQRKVFTHCTSFFFGPPLSRFLFVYRHPPTLCAWLRLCLSWLWYLDVWHNHQAPVYSQTSSFLFVCFYWSQDNLDLAETFYKQHPVSYLSERSVHFCLSAITYDNSSEAGSPLLLKGRYMKTEG